MGNIYADEEVRGINNVEERIIEELHDLRYELEGPESYDMDYRRELKENDEWQDELDRWEATGNERARELEGLIDGLNVTMRLCREAIKSLYSRAQDQRQKYNRGKASPARMSMQESNWRKWGRR